MSIVAWPGFGIKLATIPMDTDEWDRSLARDGGGEVYSKVLSKKKERTNGGNNVKDC